jgi:hypothetical protein
MRWNPVVRLTGFGTMLLAGLLFLTSSCGGGGGGDPPPGPTVLFVESFDGPWPSMEWVPSSLTDIGLDSSYGATAAPCLRIGDPGIETPFVTSSVQPWPVAGGIQVCVRVRLPDDSLCKTVIQPGEYYSFIEILQLSSGTPIAGVQFLRHTCVPTTGAGDTNLRYWSRNDNNNAVETFPGGWITGQWMTFCFVVRSDGDALWTRDGITKLETTSGPYWPMDTSESYILRLSGVRAYPSDPRQPIHFDDVHVEK